jgi:cell division septation protein DedD
LAKKHGWDYDHGGASMSEPGIRNLDQLQEQDDAWRTPPRVTLALVALGGGCVAFAALAMGGRASQSLVSKADPIGDLVSQHAAGAAASRGADVLSRSEVTFPQRLSDDARPTTALAAVRVAASEPAQAPAPPLHPPPPTDRLPVVPLPAQAVLEATPIITRPRDAMTKAATDAAQMVGAPASAEAAPSGHDGGYQLQVSSFHTQGEAEAFAGQLRARGHKAYVLEAHVPGRGTWYRVRIGPFQTQHAATQYRASFEEREHVVPFVVPPETTAKIR